MWDALSDARTGLSFTIAAGSRQGSHSRPESRGTHDQILSSQIRDFPNLKYQIPVFMSPRDRVTQLYPQSPGSLFVVSYDSQDYGGGIRPRLHASFLHPTKLTYWLQSHVKTDGQSASQSWCQAPSEAQADIPTIPSHLYTNPWSVIETEREPIGV
jgi:hypothetical protein